MSRTTDKILVRSVYKISFSDMNGLLASSCIGCKDEMDNLGPGTDKSLRHHARLCLRKNLGWIDSAGQLVKERYPQLVSLSDGFKLEISPAPGSQSFSVLTTPTVPGPEVVCRI
jgi:hypothetical protein